METGWYEIGANGGVTSKTQTTVLEYQVKASGFILGAKLLENLDQGHMI